MSGIDVANIMIEKIRTFTIDDIERNTKFPQFYGIIDGDPAQLVKKVNWAGMNVSLAQRF